MFHPRYVPSGARWRIDATPAVSLPSALTRGTSVGMTLTIAGGCFAITPDMSLATKLAPKSYTSTGLTATGWSPGIARNVAAVVSAGTNILSASVGYEL